MPPRPIQGRLEGGLNKRRVGSSVCRGRTFPSGPFRLSRAIALYKPRMLREFDLRCLMNRLCKRGTSGWRLQRPDGRRPAFRGG